MPLLTDGTVTTTAEVLSRIQADAMVLIKVKYSDLQKNLTPHFLTTGLDLDCRSGSLAVENGGQFAGLRISHESKPTNSGLVQSYSSISHFDCMGRLIFTERIKSVGKIAKQISVQDATKFVRYFEVQSDEVERQYHIENALSERVFSVQSQRVTFDGGERIYSAVEVGGAKWLELDQLDPSVNERKIFIKMNTGDFWIGKSKFSMNMGSSGSLILKTLWNERRIEHGINDDVTNQINFDTMLSGQAVGLTTQMLSFIFSEFIEAFPATQKVQVGVSDSPFLRELQLNYNRMLTNTESEQVKLFLQKTIEDIKTGRIKVE